MKVMFEFNIRDNMLNSFLAELEIIKNFAELNSNCLMYEYLVSKNNVFVIEEWTSDEALSQHRSSDKLKLFRQKVSSYLLQDRTAYRITKT